MHEASDTSTSTARLVAVRAAHILNDATMGFLALAAVTLAAQPFFFAIGPDVNALLIDAEWVIVGIFAVEYLANLALAADKKAHVLSAWRLLDLATVVLPFVALLPHVSGELVSAPALRLLRLLRAAVFTARAGTEMISERKRRVERALGPMQVSFLREGAGSGSPGASWDDVLRRVAEPDGAWYHASGLDSGRFERAACAAGLPPGLLEKLLKKARYTRWHSTGPYTSLFTWFPRARDGERLDVERSGTLLLVGEKGLFTLSQDAADLQDAVVEALPRLQPPADLPYPVRLTYAYLRLLLEANSDIVHRLEEEIHLLEDEPARENRQVFFAKVFHVEREISAAKYDLARLKTVLATMGQTQRAFKGLTQSHQELLGSLTEEVSHLHDALVHSRESLHSLIGMHINVASFEMNKVMRVLAIVSVLGMIPAVFFGILSLNLEGVPKAWSLGQVLFGMSTGTLMCLYVFHVKGWLR